MTSLISTPAQSGRYLIPGTAYSVSEKGGEFHGPILVVTRRSRITPLHDSGWTGSLRRGIFRLRRSLALPQSREHVALGGVRIGGRSRLLHWSTRVVQGLPSTKHPGLQESADAATASLTIKDKLLYLAFLFKKTGSFRRLLRPYKASVSFLQRTGAGDGA